MASAIVAAVRQAAMAIFSRATVSATLSASMARITTGKKAIDHSVDESSQAPTSRPKIMVSATMQRMTATRAYRGIPDRRMAGRTTTTVLAINRISSRLGIRPIS